MKKYSGQKLYDEMEKVPFLNRNISIRETNDVGLIKRCIDLLDQKKGEYKQEAVIVPWVSHRGLSIDIFGYSVCTKEFYEELEKRSKNNDISGDPYPARAYKRSVLEKKLLLVNPIIT